MSVFFSSLEQALLYWEKKKRNFYFLFIVLVFSIILIEAIIYRLPFKEHIKIALENSLVYLSLIFIPFFILNKNKKRSIIIFLLTFLFVLIVSYLRETRIISGIFNSLFFITFLMIFYLSKDNRETLNSLGMTSENILLSLILGIIAGILLGFHLMISATLTKLYFVEIPLESYQLNAFLHFTFYRLALGVLGEEIFYRGFIFKKLQDFGLSFWSSSLISTFAYIFLYLANPGYSNNLLVICATIFYLLIASLVYCAIFKQTKSLITSIMANLIFSIFVRTVELIKIF